MLRVGIVGLGYWGPNLVRCFQELDQCKVTAVCDRSGDRLLRIKDRFPGVHATGSLDDLLRRKVVDAIVIATPTATHYELAARALDNDLHVFVEKPLARTSDQCRQLVASAASRDRTLYVGHIFLHAAPVRKLHELVRQGELGEINYISSRRLNLGPIRQDVNALWDLAPHDVSMMLYLLDDKPLRVSCSGLAHLNSGVQDVCNLTMHFAGNRMGMVHVSWLDPRKERVLTVVGSRRMAVYDDLDQEKVKVYDKGVVAPKSSGDFADFQFSYRYGGSYSPWIQEREPLKAECEDFVRCVLEGRTPLTDGVNGLHVTEVLEAATRSLDEHGRAVELVAADQGAAVA